MVLVQRRRLALLSSSCYSAVGLRVSGVLLLLRGLNIDDALDDQLDELGGEVSPWLLGRGECCSVWCDLVSPLPVLLGLVSSPCSVGVLLLMLS